MPATLANLTHRQLLEERAECTEKARKLYDEAKAEHGESIPADKREQIDKLVDRATECTSELQNREAARNAGNRISELEGQVEEPGNRRHDPEVPGNDGARQDGSPFTVDFPLRNRHSIRQVTLDGHRTTNEYLQAFNAYLRGGAPQNALQTDDDEQAGYLVPPEQFVAELIKTVDDAVFFRQLARVFTVREAKALGAPKRKQKLSSFAWSAEIEKPTADTSLKFGKRQLYPHYLTGSILVSRDLLRANVMNADTIVREELARDAGEVEEQAFLTGDGNEKPLGVFTASNEGISTSRDVSSGNTSTEIRYDGLIEAKYSLKTPYWRTANWFFHRDAMKQIVLLKDGEGRPLWIQSLREGEPDRLLNLPLRMSEFAPNTFTTGKYVGILGAFENYWIADALDMELQRLNELNARTNQVEFLGRMKVDGAPTLEEAFSRVQLA